MNKTVFGSFQAAITLDKLITDDKMRIKITRFFQHYNEGLNELHYISNTTISKRMASLWRDEFLKTVDFDSKTHIDNYVRNVITTYYRKFIREL